MGRRGWVASATVLALLLAVVITNGLLDGTAAPVPASCPQRASQNPSYTGLPISFFRLVPFIPDHALICRYSGVNPVPEAASALIGHGSIAGANAARLARSASDAVTRLPLGPVNCPADDGASIDVYFWNGDDHIRVLFDSGGCQVVSNGAMRGATVAGIDIIAALQTLTPDAPTP